MLSQESTTDYSINTKMHDPFVVNTNISEKTNRSDKNRPLADTGYNSRNIFVNIDPVSDNSDWQTVKTKKKTKVIVKGKSTASEQTINTFSTILEPEVNVVSPVDIKQMMTNIKNNIKNNIPDDMADIVDMINTSESTKEAPILLSENDQFDKINDDIINNDVQYTDTERGLHLKFKNKWKIFVHKAESVDWSIDSFEGDYYIVDSVGSFMIFFNNFYKLNSKQYNFFIMKSQPDNTFVEPTWEHEQNRGGGICSIRIDSLHGVELMQQLCLLMMNNLLIPNMDIINGISYGVKTNWALIKIWTNDKVEDISKLLPASVVGGYNNINIRYKQNVPEY